MVGTRLGMCGVEYFAHPWEFGPRKTKELMLTGDSLDVEEAHALGMVSKIFPPDELAERTLEFAQRIAELPTMTALLIKESVNQTVDNMGFYNGLQACFTLHQLNHSHWAEMHENKYPVGHARGRRRQLAGGAPGRPGGEGSGSGTRPGEIASPPRRRRGDRGSLRLRSGPRRRRRAWRRPSGPG